MPVPMMNIRNGGEHADNNVDIQEFMVQPVYRAHFCRGVESRCRDFPLLEKSTARQRIEYLRGDEGGFAPNLSLQ